MSWEVEYTDEFEKWWQSLIEKEQVAVDASVRLLELLGPSLRFPHSSGVKGSRHGHMRELRTQFGGKPLRSLYAFDTRRRAILLIGGDKTGNDRCRDRITAVLGFTLQISGGQAFLIVKKRQIRCDPFTQRALRKT